VLKTLNAGRDSNERPIQPAECLVFEDSVAGVDAGRRAGMRVVRVPHPDVAVEYQAWLKSVLAVRSGLFELGEGSQLGEIDDGWAECIASLEDFDYEKYGIDVPSWLPLQQSSDLNPLFFTQWYFGVWSQMRMLQGHKHVHWTKAHAWII